jgi:hypothetical protein
VICNWRAILGDEVIHGEHHLRGVHVRPLSIFSDCPVSATATYPYAISHDFANGPAVRSDVDFGIENLSTHWLCCFLTL